MKRLCWLTCRVCVLVTGKQKQLDLTRIRRTHERGTCRRRPPVLQRYTGDVLAPVRPDHMLTLFIVTYAEYRWTAFNLVSFSRVIWRVCKSGRRTRARRSGVWLPCITPWSTSILKRDRWFLSRLHRRLFSDCNATGDGGAGLEGFLVVSQGSHTSTLVDHLVSSVQLFCMIVEESHAHTR